MFKEGSEVSVLVDGSLIKGKIVASAKDDTGQYAYEIEAPNNALGAPAKWRKAADVFMLEKTAQERAEVWSKL
jgi:hypothetical protein